MKILNKALRSYLAVRLVLLWGVIACCGVAGVSQDLKISNGFLANGSFETGESAPMGWSLHRGASWTTATAHSGTRSLSGVSKAEEIICESEIITLKPGADYRLDGWIACASGIARLGVDVLDERGRAISQHVAPPVRASRGWRYVAAEFTAPQSGITDHETKTSARIWFRVKGQAELDDVGFAPAALSFMGNKGLEADERGRIGFWGEEKDDSLLPGRRAGEIRPDKEIKREGKSSALLTV